ncbi:MAG: nucleotidyltransferase family protein [Planctomycetota bacterium]|jgi:molybdenum cofactor cytidylyltransferase
MTTTDTKVALVVLAAGDSTRMGNPKALLDWHGKPLLRHVLDMAGLAGCARKIVVLGRDNESIQRSVDLSDTEVAINDNPDDGQISSLKIGLAALDYSVDCVACWPVDCPLILPADVTGLVDSYVEKRHSRQRIFIPTHKGQRGHPMLIDSCLRPDVLNLPNEKTARDLIDALKNFVTEVPSDNLGVLVDVDTPEEYQKALKFRS